MEIVSTEEALLSLEKTLENFHETASKNSDDEKNVENNGDKQNNEKTGEKEDAGKGKGHVNDFIVGDNNENATESSSDLEKNTREAFNQFKVKPVANADSETSAATVPSQKQPSAEDIAKNWQQLGVHRCPNCKFMTDNNELFKNHYTTCPAVKTTGMIKLTYKDAEFNCGVCDDSWTNRGEFEEHVVCHLQESPYVCLTCQNKKFASRQQIEIHTKVEHPNGDARCGLKGMKNGRKYTEELIQAGTVSIQGKLSIPKTPRNHITQVNTSKGNSPNQDSETGTTNVVITSTTVSDVLVNPSVLTYSVQQAVITTLKPPNIPIKSTFIPRGSTIHYKPEGLTVNSSQQNVTTTLLPVTSTAVSVPMLTLSTNVVASSSTSLKVSSVTQSAHGSQSTDSAITESSRESDNNRPMPPARTSTIGTNIIDSYLYTSKGGTLVRVSPSEQAKSKHLDSLFGELDRTTNLMQPTTVSQKIKDIANPAHDITKKETVSKPIPYNLKTITEYTCTPAVKTVTPSVSTMAPQNVFLVPVGQPIMQTRGTVALQNTGIIYQTPSHGSIVLPIQPVNQTAQVSSVGSGANIRGQLTTVPHNLQVGSQISQNPVILTTGSAKVNINSNYRPANPVILPRVQSTVVTLSNPPPSYQESVSSKPDTGRSKYQTVSKLLEVYREDGEQIPKKYLFKIKPGQGFVCEHCKKFTRDEFVFRRHVWDHFHGSPLACRTCPVDYITHKVVMECKLVNNIVCNLIKKSVKDQQQDNSRPLKVLKIDEKEVIDITDDEDDKNEAIQQDKQDHATEVIVLDDDDENGDGQGLKIRISATFSLSDAQNLEQMAKKDQTGEGNEQEMQITEKNDQLGTQSKTPQTNSSIQGKLLDGSNDTTKAYETDVVQSKVTGEEQTKINVIADVEKSSQAAKDAESTDALSGQVHLKKYFCHKKTELPHVPGDKATDSSAFEESEDDEDGKVKGNLLDKSLSEPEKDSEEVVSQVLETNLKVYDPSNKAVEQAPMETDVDAHSAESNHQIPNDAYLYVSDAKSKKMESRRNSADTYTDHVNIHGKNMFDTEILSKQSHNAFYVCGYENCSFTCMSSSKYREHLQSKEHGNEYNFVCGHCGQKDYTEDTHVRHIFSHANSKTFLLYKCPIRLCKYKTNLLHLYAEHLRAHPNEELTVKCVYCHKTFPTIDSLVQHLKQNLLKFVICPYCSFRFVNRYIVMVHIKQFHPDKIRMVSVTSQVVCNEREINFYVSPKSKAFIQSDISAKDIPDADNLDIPTLLDDFQKESAGKEKSLQEHSVGEKGSENGDIDDVLSLPEEDQGDFKEKENRLKGQKENQMGTASRKPIKNKGKLDSSKDGPKSLACPKCSYLSYNQSLHAKHLSLHDTEPEREKRFVCNLCPKGFESVPHFKTHMRNHVGKHVIKILSCTTCAYSSNQKCHIMDHVRDAHSEKTLYTLKEENVESSHSECRYCSFKARTTEQVVAHETAVHRVDKRVSLSKSVGNVTEEKEHGSENSEKLTLVQTENEPGTSGNKSESSVRKKKYKYHCEYCSDFFKHKSNLKEHIVDDHKETENKQFIFFKCKYCVYTSTMKDMIIGHLGEEHPGMDLRILRKIEMIESIHLGSPESYSKEAEKGSKMVSEIEASNSEGTNETNKEEVVLPDGNVFKQMFSCPKCQFTSNMRIKTIKHLKEHPELKPVRPDQQESPTKRTARKSSFSSFPKVDKLKIKSSLFQETPKSSQPLQNPFIAVKESVLTKNLPSLAEQLPVNSPSKDSYVLGEHKLHSALSACFLPLEKDMKYQCRICKQKIFKKFVLHRHVLDHLKVVFFKCRYCGEGSIERTLMAGHIQKEHSSKTVSYDSIDKFVLEQQFKERIFNQDFNDTVDIYAASGTQGGTVDQIKNSTIVKKPVHEFQTIDDDSEDGDDVKEEPFSQFEESNKIDSLKCPKCRYIARYKYNLSLHLDSHEDPMKAFTCSVCDYRGDKFSVIKHVYRVFHLTQAIVLQNGHPLYNKQNPRDKSSCQMDKNRKESKISVAEVLKKEHERQSSVESDISLKSVGGKQIKAESLTVSKTGIYEIRTAYKCKECGEKRDSRSAMYHHLKTSKCNKPVMKCSFCSFQNVVKAAIQRHAVKRHPGKKLSILSLPMAAKIRTYRFPVRQGKNTLKDLDEENTVEESKTKPKLNEFSGEKGLKIQEEEPSDSGQIRCQLCAKYVCESVMKLQFHVNTTHQGAVLYCQKCSYKSPLVKHMINHCTNLHYQRVALYGSKPATSVKKTETAADVKPEAKPEKLSRTIKGTDDNIVFKCPKCNLELKALHSVQTHLYVHFNYRPYCCKYCGKNMTRADHMKSHTEGQHEGKPVKYDTNRDETIESKVKKIFDGVKRNVMKQKMMLGKSRPSYLDQIELIEYGIRKKEKLFYCDFCPYKSDRKATVKKHVKSRHAGISKKRPLEIDSDTEASPVRKVMKKEDTSVSGSIPLSSDEEEDETEQSDDTTPLKYKVFKSPSGTKKYKCTDCDYMNEKIKNLKLHVWRIHSPSKRIQETSVHGEKEAVFRCYFCSYTSKYSSSDVYKHFKSHHPSKNIKYINKSGHVVARDNHGKKEVYKEDKSSPAKSTSSSSPARSFKEEASSDSSPVKPAKPRTGVTNYNCNICDYSKKGFYHFRLHLIAHKEFTQLTSKLDDESRMSCGFCLYLAKNTFDLSSHIASHMAEMRYKCAYCDYAHYERFKVSNHARHWHTDRAEMVIDRELKKRCSGTIKLVNFSSVVELNKVKSITKKKKYRRIMIETDESSNSSSSDVDDIEMFSSFGETRAETRTDTSVSQASSNEPGVSCETGGNDEALFGNWKKDVSDDRGPDVSESELVESEKNAGKCQSYINNSDIAPDTESDTRPFGDTQMFRVESQPFSPSDLFNTADDHLSETESENPFSECSKVKCSNDLNETESENILEANLKADLKNKIFEQTVETLEEEECGDDCMMKNSAMVTQNNTKCFGGSLEQIQIETSLQSEKNEVAFPRANDILKDDVENVAKCKGETNKKDDSAVVKTDKSANTLVAESVETYKTGASLESRENETKCPKTDDHLKDEEDCTSLETQNDPMSKNSAIVKTNVTAATSFHENVELNVNETSFENKQHDPLKDTVEDGTSIDQETLGNDSVVNNNHVLKTNVDENAEQAQIDSSFASEQKETKCPREDDLFKDVVKDSLCKDSSIKKSETKNCTVTDHSLINNKRTDTSTNFTSTNFVRQETENACSSTNNIEMNEISTTQNEGQKSPRNVFDSLSNVKESEYMSKPRDESIMIPSYAVNRKEELKNRLNDDDVNANVFEKFTSEIHGESSELSERKNDDDKCEERHDNIFEKLTNDTNTTASTESESGLDLMNENEEESDKNIFEKFGGVENENVTEDRFFGGKEDDANKRSSDLLSIIHSQDVEEKANNDCKKELKDNESNIFVKFSSENLELVGTVEMEQGHDLEKSDEDESNIFTKFSDNRFTNEEEGSESKVDDEDGSKNLFEKFAVRNLDSQSSHNTETGKAEMTNLETDSNDKNTNNSASNSGLESENNVEDMEVDELIRSIEKTVNEGVTEEPCVSRDENTEMETD